MLKVAAEILFISSEIPAPNNADAPNIHTGLPKHIFNVWCSLLFQKKN
jgi:hypothetical protein